MKQQMLTIGAALSLLTLFIVSNCTSSLITTTPIVETEVPKTLTPELTATPKYQGAKLEAENCNYGGIIKSIEAIDDLTVKFSLCVPDNTFLQKIAHGAFAIQPSEYLVKAIPYGNILKRPIGSGPFVFSEWMPGKNIVLKRFDDYWGEKAKIKVLEFQWEKNPEDRYLELISSPVDGIASPPIRKYPEIKSNELLKLEKSPAPSIYYLGFNQNYPPFSDVRVRKAILYGIDRKSIFTSFNEDIVPATYFGPCTVEFACLGREWDQFDPKLSKELLAAAGYATGLQVDFVVYQDPKTKLAAPNDDEKLIARQLWNNIGVKVNFVPTSNLQELLRSGKFNGMWIWGWIYDYPHVSNFLSKKLNPSGLEGFGDIPLEIIETLQKANMAQDISSEVTRYTEVNNLIQDDATLIPLYYSQNVNAFYEEIKFAHAPVFGSEKFSVMYSPNDLFLFIQSAEPNSLYCNDETMVEDFRVCDQITEALMGFDIYTGEVVPRLATSCDGNETLLEYTCHLREGVLFHDGTTLDANDVVVSYTAILDASSPLHKGNTGNFEYAKAFWGKLMNEK